MLKTITTFGLTHRTLIIMGLMMFIGGGLIAFTKLDIEACPDPAPVILEITAQQAGLSAEEMEKYAPSLFSVGSNVPPPSSTSVSQFGCRGRFSVPA